MKASFTEAEKEILEVERRLVARAERMGRNWRDLRTATKKRYAFPALVAAAAVGALAVGAAAGRGRNRTAPTIQFRRGEEKTTVMAKLIAVASLVSTLRRLPIEPLAAAAMDWMRRRRRTAADTNSRASPISSRGRLV